MLPSKKGGREAKKKKRVDENNERDILERLNSLQQDASSAKLQPAEFSVLEYIEGNIRAMSDVLHSYHNYFSYYDDKDDDDDKDDESNPPPSSYLAYTLFRHARYYNDRNNKRDDVDSGGGGAPAFSSSSSSTSAILLEPRDAWEGLTSAFASI